MYILLKEILKDKINQKKLHDAKRLIIEKNLFDYDYYINQYPEVTECNMDLLDHYLKIGYKEGKNPSENFDTDYYLRMYGDVRQSQLNPLEHYVLYGLKEGRKCTTKLNDEQINHIKEIAIQEGLFDEEYYRNQDTLLKDADIDLFRHYLYVGSDEGLNPSQNFDTIFYNLNYKDSNRDKLNPLVHYILEVDDEEVPTRMQLTDEQVNKCVSIIDDSNTFDDEYYLEQNPDLLDENVNLIEHYVTEGYFDCYNPTRLFDTEYYFKNNPDIRAFAENPYVHYITNGKREGRSAYKTKTVIAEEQSRIDELEEQIKIIEQSGLFDEEYYLNKYEEAKYSLEGPIYHYLTKGAKKGYNPSKDFSTNYYLYANDDVKKLGINPLIHYITVGLNEGRSRTIKYLNDTSKQYYCNQIEEHIKQTGYTKYSADAPYVSIIMLNRDGREHLIRLFKTFKERTNYPNYEIIIVDNNSQDDSKEIIKQQTALPIVLIENKINKTFSEANNQAVEVAKGQYLLFLNNDVEVFDGWLNHLMDTALSNKNIAAVGSRLIYPDSTESIYNKTKSYTIQHAGIVFRQENGSIKPYNKDNGIPYDLKQTQIEERVAVTAASLLVEKSKYLEVGGFDNRYNYGYEDVDLCLKFYKKGYKNYYNPNSILFHYEFGTQETNEKQIVKNRRLNNLEVFNKKWNTWLKREVLNDKVTKRQLFTDQKLKIALTVTEKGVNAQAGDYFTALGLSDQLNNMGYETKFYAMRSANTDSDWYKLDEDIDVVISLLDRYDLNKIECNNKLLIKVAWVRNWIERWVEQEYFEDFDMILASSKKAVDYIRQNTGFLPTLFPIASDTNMFSQQTNTPDDKYSCDYCFTGSYWDADRQIIQCLSPEDIDYKFNLYGANWNKIPGLSKYHKGFIKYNELPSIYASTKLVIDDANHVTIEYGSVNSRVFDSIASGRLVITNCTIGNQELFNGLLPEYHSKEELTQQINYYLDNPDKREEKIKQLQKIVNQEHTYQIRAEKFIQLIREYVNSTKIIIKAPIPKSKNKNEWGDYHFGINLQREFIKRGCPSKIQLLDDWEKLDDGIYDIVIVLRGLSIYTPKSQHYNIMWNISHPDDITFGEYEKYDKVYIASTYWAEKIDELVNVDVEALLQCTNPELFHKEYSQEYDTELLFVGNSRLIYRKILKDLLPTEHKLDVYGAMWEGLIDDEYIKDEYIPNNQLHKAYSSTKILLNDHWDDMREKGFISNRIFDAIACQTVILTDHVRTIEDIFADAVVYYDSPDELEDKIDEALNIKNVDSKLIAEHTFSKRAEKIISDYKNSIEKVMDS